MMPDSIDFVTRETFEYKVASNDRGQQSLERTARRWIIRPLLPG